MKYYNYTSESYYTLKYWATAYVHETEWVSTDNNSTLLTYQFSVSLYLIDILECL